MVPEIIYGHKYLCKCSVIGDNKKCYYKKGEVYRSNHPTNIYWGYITNEFGENHPWPTNPETNPLCSDKWTTYFEHLGN